MAKLNNDLTKIITARDDMKSALASKGQTVTNDIRTYAEAISHIEGGSGDIQLYDSIATMEADQTMPEGMYATVYGNEEGPVTEDTEFQQVKFPANVTVSSEVTDYIGAIFRPVGDGWANMQMYVTSENASIDIMGESSISVYYTSNDGIHYTRTVEVETFDIGATVKYESQGDSFDSRIGQFILSSVPVYNGLYQYNNYVDKDNVYLPLKSGVTVSYSSYLSGVSDKTMTNTTVSVSKITQICNDIYENEFTNYGTNDKAGFFGYNTDNQLVLLFPFTNSNRTSVTRYPYLSIAYERDSNNNLSEYGVGTFSTKYTGGILDVYSIDLNTMTYSLVTTINAYTTSANCTLYNYKVNTLLSCVNCSNSSYTYIKLGYIGQWYGSNQSSTEVTGYTENDMYSNYLKWQMCPTQFTLTQPGSLYEGEVAFGKTGVVVGTLGANPSNTFDDAAANICVKTQDAYDDMTPLVATDNDKTAGLGKNIVFIPSKRDGTPLLDTSNLTSAYDMFNSCEKLVSVATLDIHNATSTEKMFYRCLSLLAIPQLDTSNSTNMHQMFYGCTSLTTLPSLDTGSVTNMEEMCNGCTGLTAIPLLDTSHVTKMNYAFMSCTNLVSVPTLNASNATNMNNMFRVCSSLSDTSLNNILAMCTNANSYTGTKTLKYIGLSSEQATRCQSLSNYTAFTNAGWTTGY